MIPKPNSSLGHKEMKKISAVIYATPSEYYGLPKRAVSLRPVRCLHRFHTSIRPENHRNHSFSPENYSSRRKRIRIACRYRCVVSVTEMCTERRTRWRQFCSDGVFRAGALLGASEAVTHSKLFDFQVSNRVRLSHLFTELRLRKNILMNEKKHFQIYSWVFHPRETFSKVVTRTPNFFIFYSYLLTAKTHIIPFISFNNTKLDFDWGKNRIIFVPSGCSRQGRFRRKMCSIRCKWFNFMFKYCMAAIIRSEIRAVSSFIFLISNLEDWFLLISIVVLLISLNNSKLLRLYSVPSTLDTSLGSHPKFEYFSPVDTIRIDFIASVHRARRSKRNWLILLETNTWRKVRINIKVEGPIPDTHYEFLSLSKSFKHQTQFDSEMKSLIEVRNEYCFKVLASANVSKCFN